MHPRSQRRQVSSEIPERARRLSAYGTSRLSFDAVRWAVPKPQQHDFSLELTRVIEPKEGPGVELATLEDAARFMGHMRPWRQTRPHWEYAAEPVLVAATTSQEA